MQVKLPIPISVIAEAFLIFDIDAVTYLRKHHHICGVFIGTLPQNPSQNVFMGLPMQFTPEEAHMLVDSGVCYFLDDSNAHALSLRGKSGPGRKAYLDDIHTQIEGIAKEHDQSSQLRRKKGLKREMERKGCKVMAPGSHSKAVENDLTVSDATMTQSDRNEDADTFFNEPLDSTPNRALSKPTFQTRFSMTPTSSKLLLQDLSEAFENLRPLSSPAYMLTSHLHRSNLTKYCLTPGLRFGCQFCIYPGDPLRYHSHFLGASYGWEEEIDLLDLVGGGRLGTGVKKGYLMSALDSGTDQPPEIQQGAQMRTFSIEWAAM